MRIGHFTLHFIIIPNLVSTVNAQTTEWMIDSDLESCNRNENVTRAVGAKFSAAIIATCKSLGDYSCDVSYHFNDHEYGKIAIFKESQTTVSGNLDLPGSEAQVWYEYMKESNAPARIILNFTIIPPSDKEFELTLRTKTLCRGDLATVKFVGCKNETEFGVTLRNSGIARYLDEGTIICDKSEKGRAVFSNNSEALQTQCLDDATWEYASNITCLYPMPAELHIDGKPYMKTVILKFNQSSNASNEASVQCDGSSDKNILFVMLPQKEMEKNITNSVINLHPNINGANVSCYFENRYATLFGPYLSTSLLDIAFGPYPPIGFHSLCHLNNGSIKFYSNPASRESMLSLWQGETEVSSNITECCEMNYGVVGQMITPNKSLSTGNIRLRRNYSGRIENFNVVSCNGVTTTSQVTAFTSETTSNSESTSMQDFESKMPMNFAVVIILSSIGSILLLMTIVLMFCLRRRQKGKPISGAEEMDNIDALYEPSHAVVPETNTPVIPLSGTSHTNESGFDAYSVVDKKKGARKSTEAATPDVETYAVVGRSKNKSKVAQKSTESATSEVETYAVLDRTNKKTKGTQKTSESAIADVETYAAVDRKNKKAKGTQISSESAPANVETYAAVGRKNKKAKGTQKSSESAIPDVETYAAVDRKNKKAKDAQKSSESAIPNVETYAEVDRKNKKAKGAQKSSELATPDVETYAAVDRKNIKAEDANMSTESSIPDVETYAVVDRQRNKVKGAGHKDHLGSRM